MTEEFEIAGPPITELSKGQRRVLGVLLEKAFTTPEYYPLTLKAITTGCNQKNNRSPLTNYSEDDVLPIVDELRQLGLVAVIHTETGRTERYRHYMRKRFQLTEQQLAVLTELLLRGRQSVGDLRSRASRMVPINSLDELREALRGLMDLNAVQATGPLERRGVEVDHKFYLPREGNQLTYDEGPDDEPTVAAHDSRSSAEKSKMVSQSSPPAPIGMPRGTSPAIYDPNHSTRLSVVESSLSRCQAENADLRKSIDALQDEVNRVSERLSRLENELGG